MRRVLIFPRVDDEVVINPHTQAIVTIGLDNVCTWMNIKVSFALHGEVLIGENWARAFFQAGND